MIGEARGVTYRYPGAPLPAVSAADLALDDGELVGIVGPNGSGKTTLIRLLLGALAPESGTVTIRGRPVTAWSRRELAQTFGVVVQREEPAFPLRVRQVVMLGRYPHLPALGSPRDADRAAVDRALHRCDVADLAERWTTELSGGEWQRVRIARALAQEPRALVLDEASANLDLRHEMELFELVADLARTANLGVLMISHHVNLLARFAHRILVLDRGVVRAGGPVAEVVGGKTLEQVFDWPLETIRWNGVPQIIPLRKSETR